MLDINDPIHHAWDSLTIAILADDGEDTTWQATAPWLSGTLSCTGATPQEALDTLRAATTKDNDNGQQTL